MSEFLTCLGADIPATISLADAKPRKIERVLTCAPDTFAVVDLGNSVFALVRATAADAPASR